jgi:hypothetical protein
MSRKFPLTQKQYVSEYGSWCPFCGAPDVIGELDTAYFYRFVASITSRCDKCHKKWRDYFELSGYDEVENE